jgi:FkbM family methyltransferase
LLFLGTDYGGWFIPAVNNLDSESICYSAGAGEDISFDIELSSMYHCKVRIVDPTPKAVAHFSKLMESCKNQVQFPINNSKTEFYNLNSLIPENVTFYPVGLAGYDGVVRLYEPINPNHASFSKLNLQKSNKSLEFDCLTLMSLMRMLGDTQCDLFKIDIEGAEYEVLEDMVESQIRPRILLVEFDELHTPLDNSASVRIENCLSMLARYEMKLIWRDNCNFTFVDERTS